MENSHTKRGNSEPNAGEYQSNPKIQEVDDNMRNPHKTPSDLRPTLVDECRAMISYASARGIPLPAAAVTVVGDATDGTTPVPLANLSDAHQLLARAVAPAAPDTIRTVNEEHKDGFLRYLGATNYARVLSVLAIIAFFTFVTLQVVNTKNWQEVLLTALASIIGGIFYVMFELSRRLADGTFNRGLEGQYTILIILGGLAGTALAFLIVRPTPAPAGDTTGATIEVLLTRPLLALLGGFSARVVYRVLERLVETVEALIKGAGNDMVAAQEQAAQARAAADTITARTRTLQQLVALSATTTSDQHRTRLNEVIEALLGDIQRVATPSPPAPSLV